MSRVVPYCPLAGKPKIVNIKILFIFAKSFTVKKKKKKSNHLDRTPKGVMQQQEISFFLTAAIGHILYLLTDELCMIPMWLCLLFLHCIYLCKQACMYVCMPFQLTWPAFHPPLPHPPPPVSSTSPFVTLLPGYSPLSWFGFCWTALWWHDIAMVTQFHSISICKRRNNKHFYEHL